MKAFLDTARSYLTLAGVLLVGAIAAVGLGILWILVGLPRLLAYWCTKHLLWLAFPEERGAWAVWKRHYAQPYDLLDAYYRDFGLAYENPFERTPETYRRIRELSLHYHLWQLLRVRYLRSCRKQGMASWRVRTMACLTS